MNGRQLRSFAEACVSRQGSPEKGLKEFSDTLVEKIRGDEKGKLGFPGSKVQGVTETVGVRDIFKVTTGLMYPNEDFDSMSKKEFIEALNTSMFPNITGELINQTIMQSYAYALAGVMNLVTELDSKKQDFDYIPGFLAPDGMARVKEGLPYPVTHFGEKLARVQLEKYGRIIELTREMILGDQTGQIVRIAQRVGDKYGIVQHRLIIQTAIDGARTDLEEATSTAFYLDGSARTVFATTHSTVDGQTNANTPSSGAVPSSSTIDAAFAYAGVITDEKGDYTTQLGYPHALCRAGATEKTLWEFFYSKGKPDTTDRADNFYAEKTKPSIFTSPYISATAWYLGDFSKDLVWLWTWKPETVSQGQDSNASFERDIIARFKWDFKGGCGRTDYRHAYKGNS